MLIDSSTSSGDLSSSHSQDKTFDIPIDDVAYNQLMEHKVRLSSIYANQAKYLLHHITAEVLDTEKLVQLGKETKDLIYCFFEPAFNLQYLPTKQIFSNTQADHLALVWAPHFVQYLPCWRLKSINTEHELGIVWKRPCKEYAQVQDNLTLHLLGISYHKREHVYIGRASSQEEHDVWLKLGVPLLHTPKRHSTVTDTWYKKFVAPYTATGQTIHSFPPDEKILVSKDIDLCIIEDNIAEYNDRPSEKT